ncbi:PREDICTED: peripheral-type benzodiazepine receptor-associated protein 1-like [Crocodylus porosus]|uniref:peripheral-type benzodiazepine receptor-associated protein 1-like n=1 Tax=Crocodylus porosus TaxID=8502 RepID=UPI00094028F2|nr:PREDICTED: peripheral-type benzodiazepine receptor-associated protein 1-like [Crocodylus porosus]
MVIYGYTLYRRDRADKRDGGVVCYGKESYMSLQAEIDIQGDQLETLWGRRRGECGKGDTMPKGTILPNLILDDQLHTRQFGKVASWGSGGQEGAQAGGQQQDWLSGSVYEHLVKQNADLLSALEDLEQRCTVLKKEKCLLRRSSIPEMQEKVKWLKRKNAELATIAKGLEKKVRKLQESNLQVAGAPVLLPINNLDVELCKKAFAQQIVNDLSEQASTLLAKDKQIDALQKECWEMQAKLATGKGGSCKLNFSDLSCYGSCFIKETPTGSVALAKGIETVALPLGNMSKKHENMPLKTDPYSKQQIEHLELELGKKYQQCENLEQEIEKKQKKCDELEMQLKKVLNENLEGERLRSQELRRRFALEARELREAAERERQLLADQLRSKWEQQRARELHQLRERERRQREAEIRQLLRWKEAELREAQELLQRDRDAAVRQARDLQRQLAEELVGRARGEGRARLQEVLGRLRWETDGEQAARIRHLRAELELERSLFLKYILERFEAEQPPSPLSRAAHHLQGRRHQDGPLQSLMAACSPAGEACSLESSLSPLEAAQPALLEGSPSPAQEDACCQEETATREVPLEPSGDNLAPECSDSPPEGKVVGWASAGREGAQAVGQQQDWLSNGGYEHLVKQNADLLSALEHLEQRCTALKEENCLLRRSSVPEMQEKVKRLKRKNAELATIAKRLEEKARKLQEPSLQVVGAPVLLPFDDSDVELCKKAFAEQRVKDLSEQASTLLAKDKQIDALQKECWELQAKLATGKDGSCELNFSDFDHLLRESQKEVLRLQRQIMLRNLKESLQCSQLGSDSSSTTAMCPIQETSVPNIDASLDDSCFPKETPTGSVALANGIETVVLPLGRMSEKHENMPLKTDPYSKQQIEHLELELGKKYQQCENLEQEIEKKQKKCNELEMQLKEALNKKQYHSKTEQFNLLSQELEQFHVKKSDIVTSKLPCTICFSTAQISAEDCFSGSKSQVKEQESQTDFSKSESGQSSPNSCPSPEEDTANEMQELETNAFSLTLEAQRQGSAKLRVFLARYSYDPFEGPNKNPETELPLTAGEYVYIFGDMDEDGFFKGELMDGRRGLVPSNLVDEVSDDDLMASVPPELGDLSHVSYHETSFLSRSLSSGEKSNGLDEKICISMLTNRLEGDTEVPSDYVKVPYPRNLTLIKQLARSIIIGWEPPFLPADRGDVQSYNIYVDKVLYQNVRFGCQTEVVIENMDLNAKTYRISVQSVMEKGNSDKMQCTFLVGKDFHKAPELLKIRSITATSAEVTWLPSSSNYTHVVYLNEEKYDVTKAGIYWYTFQNLQPNTQYTVQVDAQPQKMTYNLSQEKWMQKSATVTFVTPSTGLPDAPLDVQVEPGPSVDSLVISWLPVTIDAAGSSNGVQVTGYAVYVNGQRVTEVMSPITGSVLVELSQLEIFQVSQKVSVRTLSPYGESVDSVPALIPSALLTVKKREYSKSVPTSLTPEHPCGELIDSQPVKKCLTHSTSSLSSQLDVARKNEKCTVCFTSSCRDSLTSLPANVSPQQLFTSHSSSLMPELAMSSMSPIPRNEYDNKCVAYQQTSVSVQSLSLAFPARLCEESASARTPKDIRRKRTEQLFLTQNDMLKNQVDASNIKMSMTTHYVNSEDKSVKDSAIQRHIERDDRNWLSSVPRLCSSQLELQEDYNRDIKINTLNVQEILDVSEKKPEEVLILGVSVGETKKDQTPGTGNWKCNFPGEHNRNSVLLGTLTEEEEELDLDREEDNRIKIAGKDSCLKESPEFPTQWSQIKKMSKTLSTSQAVTSSFSRTDFLKRSDLKEMVSDGSTRMFLALFDYDPASMSPNLDAAEEELPFKKGQVVKVIGDKDVDGFYQGEIEGKVGYIPCNMVSEVEMDSIEMKQQLLKQASVTDTDSRMNLVKLDIQDRNDKSHSECAQQDSKVEQSASKTMVAVFDYNPRESSINVDVESELTFSAGDIITVFGSVDDGGFYYGELNGQRGLIPSEFLKAASLEKE